jgi:type II secretory pathway pseudopilin PulG
MFKHMFNVTTRRMTRRAFTLAEVLLAIGLAAVALLALLAQSTLLVSSNQKQDNSMVAVDVAYSVMEDVAAQVRKDIPTGRRSDAFDQDSTLNVFLDGTERVGHTDYNWQLFVRDVDDTITGSPVGAGASGSNVTKLKSLEIVVSWWEQANNERQGMGKLEIRATKLLNITNGP